jgi:hypothetical protein
MGQAGAVPPGRRGGRYILHAEGLDVIKKAISMRRKAEKLALAVMAGSGIAVLVADQLELDRLAPDGTLSKITLLILSTVTLFLLLEVGRFEELDNINLQLSKLDIDGIARRLQREHYAGVTKVHPRFSEDAYLRYVESARDEVTILNTWIPNLHRLEQSLSEAIINRRVDVRILLLFPNSGVAQLRDEALRGVRDPALQENVKEGVERCLSILEVILKRIGDDRSGHLQVRVYNSLPSISVYRADTTYFVSMFLHGQLAIDSPQFEINGQDTILGNAVQHELDTLWGVGHDVDLHDWRRALQAMRP